MHGAAASAQHSSTGSATRSADRMAQLEDGQGDSGGDASMPLCLREEEGEGEEDDQTSLVPLALEQNRTLNGMVTRLVNQRWAARQLGPWQIPSGLPQEQGGTCRSRVT